jgi:hypothetical protein
MIKLVLLYEQIIKEVGDLENITPYEWNKISKIKYNFLDKDGDKIYVDFQLYDKNDLESIEFSSNIQDPTKVYNVSYSLQGKQSQYKKDDYVSLIKIIKTVFDILKDFITNESPSGITFFAGNKNEDFILSKTDPQKGRLYKTILLKNLSKFPGWSFTDTNLGDDFKGFIFYKK